MTTFNHRYPIKLTVGAIIIKHKYTYCANFVRID